MTLRNKQALKTHEQVFFTRFMLHGGKSMVFSFKDIVIIHEVLRTFCGYSIIIITEKNQAQFAYSMLQIGVRIKGIIG